MTTAIQFIDENKTMADAIRGWIFQQSQIGYLGGRILVPSDKRDAYVVQSFHDSDGLEPNAWLPDGCRHVVLTNGIKRACAI